MPYASSTSSLLAFTRLIIIIIPLQRYPRNDLRKREAAIRTLREAAALHEIETHKWQRERETYEDRINQLEVELPSALEAHTHIDEQKQENLLLKETIDRMQGWALVLNIIIERQQQRSKHRLRLGCLVQQIGGGASWAV